MLIFHRRLLAATMTQLMGAKLMQILTNLSARFASSILSSLNEAGIPIDTNNSIVQSGAVDVAHRILGIRSMVVFEKAKAAWRLFVLVQAHDDAPNFAGSREQFMDLFFGCEKGHVAHIQCGGIFQQAVLFIT